MESKECLSEVESKNMLSTVMGSENSNISKSTTNQLNEINNKTGWNIFGKIQSILNTVIPIGYRHESNGDYKRMKKDDSINIENNDDDSEDEKRMENEDEEREKKVKFRSQKPPINELLYKRWCKQEKKRNNSNEEMNVDLRNIQLPTYGIKYNVSKADGSLYKTIRKITQEDSNDYDNDENKWFKINDFKLKKEEDTEDAEPNVKIYDDQNVLKKAKLNEDKEIIEGDSKNRKFEMISQNELKNNEEFERNEGYEKIIIDIQNIQLPQYVLKPIKIDANGNSYKTIEKFELEDVTDQEVIEQVTSITNTFVKEADNEFNEVTANDDIKVQKGCIAQQRQMNELQSEEAEDAEKKKIDEMVFRKGEHAMINRVCEPNLKMINITRTKILLSTNHKK